MGEYRVRSLPSDAETGQSRYQKWLLSVMQQNHLTHQSVDPTSSRLIDGVYRQFAFRVQGNAKTPDLIGLLHGFYSKDYLHRIRSLSVRPSRTGDFKIEMSVDAIGIVGTPSDLPEPSNESWQVSESLAAYQDTILNRNFFEPPNITPRFCWARKRGGFCWPTNHVPLVFKDTKDQLLTYALGEDAPEGVTIDQNTGTLHVQCNEKQSLELQVQVTDDGYPPRTTLQKLTINIVDPPPPPQPAPPKLKFDDAKQTVLTGLVQGRGQWQAWMHVRTRDQTLKLHAGDSFEIGSVQGEIVEVNAHHAVLESNGKRYELKVFGNLSESIHGESP